MERSGEKSCVPLLKMSPAHSRVAVAQEALDYGHDPSTFFSDLMAHGCISGMVTNLVMYTDTHAFFDQHYEDIDEMRQNFQDNTGILIQINGVLKSNSQAVRPELTAKV